MVCLKCQLFLKPKKNNVAVEERMPVGGEWKPYKLWAGDLWECKGCGIEVVSGFAPYPMREHFMEDYEDFRARTPHLVAIVDDS